MKRALLAFCLAPLPTVLLLSGYPLPDFLFFMVELLAVQLLLGIPFALWLRRNGFGGLAVHATAGGVMTGLPYLLFCLYAAPDDHHLLFLLPVVGWSAVYGVLGGVVYWFVVRPDRMIARSGGTTPAPPPS